MESKIEQLLIDLTQRIIDRSEYDYMKRQYAREYEVLLQEETKALSDIRAKDAALGATEKWLDAMKRYQKLPSIDHTLLNLLVARIEVSKEDGDIEEGSAEACGGGKGTNHYRARSFQICPKLSGGWPLS